MFISRLNVPRCYGDAAGPCLDQRDVLRPLVRQVGDVLNEGGEQLRLLTVLRARGQLVSGGGGGGGGECLAISLPLPQCRSS